MLSFIPAPIKGVLSATFFSLNTVIWCSLLYPLTAVKILVPSKRVKQWCTRTMVGIAENWISGNNLLLFLFGNIRWEIELPPDLRMDRSYLVVANHQSWVDIVMLQRVFNRRIPFLRFFLKKELIYVPLLGGAWWGLDFPFMQRFSKAYLEKHPEKRGQDLETTRRACERFRGSAISVLNFLEGTRLTPEKHRKQLSPYENLLKPKTGGIAFVIEAMGHQFDSLLDVTIFYPGGAVSLWELFSGKLREVKVQVRKVTIPSELLGGSYLEDEVFREKFQEWVRQFWEDKDRLIESFKTEGLGSRPAAVSKPVT